MGRTNPPPRERRYETNQHRSDSIDRDHPAAAGGPGVTARCAVRWSGGDIAGRGVLERLSGSSWHFKGTTRQGTDTEIISRWEAIQLALNTGLRQGELLELRWTHIDMDLRMLSVVRSKSGKRRDVPLNDSARAVLSSLPRHIRSPFVFCNPDGSRRRTIREAFKNARRRAKLDSRSIEAEASRSASERRS